MKTRGERQYVNMPVFAARLYDNLTSVKGVNRSFDEIAEYVKTLSIQGKLLDVGTGPGRLLFEINKKNPNLELYGLDISASMLEVAKQNLRGISNVNLRVGNIKQTDFEDNFFECIISSGSFYNWDNPVEGLNEIHRILKDSYTAYIYDSYKDYDEMLLNSRLIENLKGYNFIRKNISKYFLKKQLRMTYLLDEYLQILEQTKFRNNYSIHKIELGNLPIYVRLELRK
jgi:ubiquinone/menaquinone biosynthesis C-methylase UbiE